MAVPWDYSLFKVDNSMTNVKIIIFQSLKVSSYFAARRWSAALEACKR